MTMLRHLLPLLALAACLPALPDDPKDVAADTDTDTDTDSDTDTDTGLLDSDGDGVSEADGDCNDDDASIFPDAIETCDGVDTNCSGDEDDAVDPSPWYADVDGDGYGDTSAVATACTAPAGYLADGTDCDDGDSTVNPAAWETCNSVDDDCDGDVDENDAIDASTWYADADGDGYGDAATPLDACDAPVGYVVDTLDCDDGDPGVNPDAIETCDSVDTNCSGDEDDAVDELSWYADTDGDGYGDTSARATACIAPAGYVADATDCDDGDDTVNPGATEVCENGVDDDCDGGFAGCLGSGSLSAADAQYTGDAANDYAGISVSTAGDVDGDGFGDLVVGASANDDGGYDAGVAYLVLGSASPSDLGLASADARYTGEVGDNAGVSVSTAGDVDGDGFGDLIVGAYYNSDGATTAGAAYLVLGSASPIDLDLGAANAQYTGEAPGDHAGCSVSGAGDFNGDGFDDLVVGAYGADDTGVSAGKAYLILGSGSPGDLDLVAADVRYYGAAAGDQAGASVSTAGDFNGDGFDDLVVGAYENDDGGVDAGTAYLILGRASPSSTVGAADAQYTGEAAGDLAGSSVSTAGDVNGDGFGDVIVGARYNDDGGYVAGAAYLVLGSASPADLDLGTADAKYTGEAAGDYAGWSVSTAGDVNVDGFGDLLIGAPYYDDGGDGHGAAYLVLGSASPRSIDLGVADARYTGEAEGDHAGGSVSTGGDVDGDGFGDLLVGASSNVDGGGTNAGAAYLILGTGL